MSKWILTVAVGILGAAMVVADVEAKRLGGGRAVGTQRNVTTPPPAKAAPNQQQAAPAPGQAAQAAPGQPAAAGQAAAAPSKWGALGGILGGLALGGLLGYLFGGSGLMGILLLAALAIGGVLLVRALMRRRAGESAQPMQLAGFGAETVAAPPPSQAAGLDQVAPAVKVPAGFDAAAFLKGAKMNFVKLQVAHDRGDLDELRELTTPEIFETLKGDVGARPQKQETEIVQIGAELLEVAKEGHQYWASVRFSGVEREAPGATPAPFEEIWNLVKPVDGSSGWLLAGIQQMH